MSVYVVTAVRFDAEHEVQAVMWAKVDPAVPQFQEALHDVPVDAVVAAFDRGDTVQLRFTVAGHNVLGPKLARKVLSGGHDRVKEDMNSPGQMLKDLPTF